MSDRPDPRQLQLAEDDLCAWLAYPTELEARPDEIECLGTVDFGTTDGPADLFVFRFRTNEPHWAAQKGWMIGVAGPYPRASQPTAIAPGHTFSKLAPETERPLMDHVRDLTGTVGAFHVSERLR